MRCSLALLTALMVGAAANVSAQVPDRADDRGWRFGSVLLKPAIGVDGVGFNSNILNETDDPKKDFTARVRPSLDIVARLSRMTFQAHGALGWSWYRRHAEQRSLDGDRTFRLELPIHRVTLHASDALVQTRDLYDPEIDLRALRTERANAAGAELRIGGRTRFDVSVRRSTMAFAAASELFGTRLQETLNRRTDRVAAQARYRATPLTTVVFSGSAEHERFAFLRERDADSLRALAGFDFARPAWLSGSARVGYARFIPVMSADPAFSAVVAAIDVERPVSDLLTVQVAVNRSIAPSFRLSDRYYVVTGVSGALIRQLSARVRVTAGAGRQRLSYRRTTERRADAPGSDVLTTGRAGIAYRATSLLTIGVNGDYYVRRTPPAVVSRDRLRLTTSLQLGY
jgi:hypothetical protein